jgi:hypothetical protein
MRIAEAFFFGTSSGLRHQFTGSSAQTKKPRHAPGLYNGMRYPRYYCDMAPDLSGTQVVCCLSYLKPGADFSASLVVFIVR